MCIVFFILIIHFDSVLLGLAFGGVCSILYNYYSIAFYFYCILLIYPAIQAQV